MDSHYFGSAFSHLTNATTPLEPAHESCRSQRPLASTWRGLGSYSSCSQGLIESGEDNGALLARRGCRCRHASQRRATGQRGHGEKSTGPSPQLKYLQR